jgi:hypothetical protein
VGVVARAMVVIETGAAVVGGVEVEVAGGGEVVLVAPAA